MFNKSQEVALLVKNYFSTLNIPHTIDAVSYYTEELIKSNMSVENIREILYSIAKEKKLLTVYEIEKTLNKLNLVS